MDITEHNEMEFFEDIDPNKHKSYDLNIYDGHETFDIDINAINFYMKGNKVIPIECHELNVILNLLKQNNITVFNDDIKNDMVNIIYDNMEYIKEELLNRIDDPDIYYFFNVDKQTLTSMVNDFILLYKSMSSNGYIENVLDSILISRISFNGKNILCLINGELRLFIAKILGFKKIRALIGDAGPYKRYLFYEYK